ncbi:MAG: methyltransferase domain-containing protein [Nocardioides sp.]|nr:methyltransferase domain-containing protein [Nocardioides sp.]
MTAEDEARRARFAEFFDFGTGHGLEIGPLAKPIAVRPAADVSYVDITDRAGLVAHYLEDPGVDTDAIPELDFWLTQPDGIVTIDEACTGGAPFDWVVASHVVEHIPDVIAWLQQIAAVTTDGGTLVLAIPDRRYSFDVHRPPTTVGQALEAHDRGDRRPQTRAVFDYFHQVVTLTPADAWAGHVPGPEARIHTLDAAVDFTRRAREGDYVDSHVWLFTPAEFVAFVDDLGRLGLVDFAVERVVPTRRDELEYYALLTRLPRGTDTASTAAERERLHGEALDSLTAEELPAGPDQALSEATARITRLERRLAKTTRQRDRARRRVRQLTGPTRWRAGVVVTAAYVRDRLRRRSSGG